MEQHKWHKKLNSLHKGGVMNMPPEFPEHTLGELLNEEDEMEEEIPVKKMGKKKKKSSSKAHPESNTVMPEKNKSKKKKYAKKLTHQDSPKKRDKATIDEPVNIEP